MDDAVLVPDRGIKLSLPLVFFNSNTVVYTVDAKRSLSGTLIPIYTYLSRVQNVFICTRTEEGFLFIFLHILSLRIDLISRAPANPITLKTDDDIGLRGASTSFQISNSKSTLSLSGLDFWRNQPGGRLLFYILA